MGVGLVLQAHYRTPQKLDALLDGGDMSVLAAEVARASSGNRQAIESATEEAFFALCDESGADYAYLSRDGRTWEIYEPDDARSTWQRYDPLPETVPPHTADLHRAAVAAAQAMQVYLQRFPDPPDKLDDAETAQAWLDEVVVVEQAMNHLGVQVRAWQVRLGQAGSGGSD